MTTTRDDFEDRDPETVPRIPAEPLPVGTVKGDLVKCRDGRWRPLRDVLPDDYKP